MSKQIEAGNIRELLGHLIGQKLVDITQDDAEDRALGRDPFVVLMFENGDTLQFNVADGEDYACGFPFCFSDPDKSQDDDGPWIPSAEDLASGNWAVVCQNTVDGIIQHCMPMHGKHHFLDETCWCNPKKMWREDDSFYFTHEEMIDDAQAS